MKIKKKVLLYEVLFYAILICVSCCGLYGALKTYGNQGIIEEIKPDLIKIQIVGVIVTDCFLIIDMNRNNKNINKIINKIILYSIVNIIYFMYVFIADGDPIFNKKCVIGDRYWWFDIFEWIDLAIISIIYIVYVSKVRRLNEENMEIEKNEK